MKAITILLLASSSLLAQSSSQYYIAKGSNTCHHKDNAKRAAAGVYGNAILKDVTFKLPLPLKTFNMYEGGSTAGKYKYWRNLPSTEEGVQKYIVISEKDYERQCITISKDFLILYRYSLNIMEIYKL